MNEIEMRNQINRMKFNTFERLSEVPNKIVMELHLICRMY